MNKELINSFYELLACIETSANEKSRFGENNMTSVCKVIIKTVQFQEAKKQLLNYVNK